MLFTSREINNITESVDFHHALFCANEVGISVLSKADKALLVKNGINLTQYKGKISPVEYAYTFGKLESSVKDKSVLKKLNLKQYTEFVDSNPDKFKLTKEDRYNIKVAKQRLYNDIKRAAGDIKSDLTQSLVEVSQLYPNAPDTKTGTKKVLNIISKKLGESNKKYNFRFTKISGYNMHSCYQEGMSAQILEEFGSNAKIYFTTHPQACPVCVKTYLKNGIGSPSKIFYLKTVIINGSNIGRKSKDIKPSVQALHPFCRCKMNKIPKGKIKWSSKQNHYVRDFS